MRPVQGLLGWSVGTVADQNSGRNLGHLQAVVPVCLMPLPPAISSARSRLDVKWSPAQMPAYTYHGAATDA